MERVSIIEAVRRSLAEASKSARRVAYARPVGLAEAASRSAIGAITARKQFAAEIAREVVKELRKRSE